nr:MAG TPA: hypothetical protein [Caudoviricetes sp.]
MLFVALLLIRANVKGRFVKSIERFLDNVAWLFYGLIPALYLSIQSSIFSYKYRLFPDFIFVYVLAIIFVLIIFLIFRMFSKYHDLKKGKSTIFSTIFSYFSFPLLSSCVTAIFLFFEFKSVDRNAIFPYLFNYLLIQFFLGFYLSLYGITKKKNEL